jgi:inosine/xanthosine triphosphatase
VNPSKHLATFDAEFLREQRTVATRVVVGSRNPVKIAAVRAVIERLTTAFDVDGVSVSSGVPDQPWGDEQTIAGARARARSALTVDATAVLAVGLEGGVVDVDGVAVRSCAWCVVVDRAGREGVGGSLAMPLPPAAASALRRGEELGPLMDRLADRSGTKHGPGAVGLLTNGLIDRQGAYETLVTYALVPWIGERFWTTDERD